MSLLPLILFSALSFGQSQTKAPTFDLTAALEHQKLARQYVEQKKWTLARDEAKLATKKSPTSEINRDAWLILAATEERLGNLDEARDAYAKYLSLSPAEYKKDVVTSRYEEIRAKADSRARYKWGAKSSGFILAHSPTFKTKMQTEVDSDMKSTSDLGFRFGAWSLGFKKGVGKAGALSAPTGTLMTSPYAVVPAGSRHVIEELYLQYNFYLTKDPEIKPVVFGIPLYMAGSAHTIRTKAEKIYTTYGYDLATGLSIDFYTKSAISFDVAALYHLGMPFGDVKNANDALPIKNSKGEIVSGSTTGTEFRIGVKILFGASAP